VGTCGGMQMKIRRILSILGFVFLGYTKLYS